MSRKHGPSHKVACRESIYQEIMIDWLLFNVNRPVPSYALYLLQEQGN
jgi:hypothetical protein